MSIVVWFKWHDPYGWYLISEDDDDEDLADDTLANAGMIQGRLRQTEGRRIHSAYFFKDPLRAAAVLRLAGFEVLPWE